MAQLIKNPQVTVVTKEVQTTNGKCEITIKLDLNLNIEGTSVTLSNKEQTEPIEYTIPEFQSQKIKFGEKVNK